MITLSIDQCRGRLHLPDNELAERPRLTALLDTALGNPLADALAGVHNARETLTFVRELEVTVRACLDAPDSQIVAEIAAVIARAIVDASSSGDAVQYQSRTHVRLDALLGLLSGQHGRLWAWMQADVCDATPDRDAAAAILLAEPREIVPLLASVASSHGSFARLLEVIAPEQWTAMARLALSVNRVPLDALALRLLAAPAIPSRATEPFSDVMVARSVALDDAHVAALACRVRHALERSRIARAFAMAPWTDLAVVIGTLALLEAEPALLGSVVSPSEVMRLAGSTLAARYHPPLIARRSPVLENSGASTAAATDIPPRSLRVLTGAESRTRREEPIRRAKDASAPMQPTPIPSEPAVDEQAADARVMRTTAQGGLLYLLHLVGELDIPSAIISDPNWSHRSLRWVLHRVALALVGVASYDAAALAFAGLSPTDVSPDSGEPSATRDEDARVADIASRLGKALVARMDLEDEPPALVRSVAERPATIVADPGWIEARFPLEAVDIRIRRVGLDRDPDYLPWLGVVVRFVYE